MRFYGLSERFGRYLEPAQGQKLHDTGVAFCERYLALARHAMKLLAIAAHVVFAYLRHKRNEMRLRPKLHVPWSFMRFTGSFPQMVLHLCMDARDKLKNFRFFHNFREEDGMQWLKCSLERVRFLPLGEAFRFVHIHMLVLAM